VGKLFADALRTRRTLVGRNPGAHQYDSVHQFGFTSGIRILPQNRDSFIRQDLNQCFGLKVADHSGATYTHSERLGETAAERYRTSSLSFYVTAEAVTHKALQEAEFGSEKDGYEAVKHQRFVGTGYFDAVQQAITSGKASTTAPEGSTEAAQFHAAVPKSSEKLSARVAAD
jgi:hypothetical protein